MIHLGGKYPRLGPGPSLALVLRCTTEKIRECHKRMQVSTQSHYDLGRETTRSIATLLHDREDVSLLTLHEARLLLRHRIFITHNPCMRASEPPYNYNHKH